MEYHAVTEQLQNLIVLKCPFGGARIHLDIICHLSQIMQGDFAILIDHVEDILGEKVYGYLIDYLRNHQISFFEETFVAPGRIVGFIKSTEWKDNRNVLDI